MHFVYVIQSKFNGSYYVGETAGLNKRLKLHNSIEENVGATIKIPWEYIYTIEVADITVARKIESHIKRMKSGGYIENLKSTQR